MNYANDPKFKSIVGLTQFRDLRGLRTGLVATIIGEIGTDFPTRLYERSSKTTAWSVVEFYNIAAQEKLISSRSHQEMDDLFTSGQREADLATLGRVSEAEIVTFEKTLDGRPRTIFPIYVGKQLLSGLIIEGHLPQEEQVFIDTILQVYTNLFLLLKNSIQDCLTGLLNRQVFDRNIQKMDSFVSKKRRGTEEDQENCCLAFFDIDHFKRVNDNFGHLHGDEVLVLFSNLMKEFFRESDDKYRYGGEEFVAVLKGVSLELATNILNKFRDRVASYLFPQVGQITVSIGVAHFDKSVPMVTVIERADKAVYYSKDNGRNRVTSWADIASDGQPKVLDASKSDVSLI
ncbi:MAG: GGDEF domain-containing protein [Pseudomonadales bacterium]|nr:GGDEF domain-containing protein [Pseudomonadales bacterium]